ncbi:MAG: permease-like cell division protein FtsX [Armatimonadota bacterium]
MLRSLEFSITEAVVAIRRNALMSLAAVVTVALSLAILGGFVLFALSLNNVIQDQMKKFEIEVFLDKDISERNIDRVHDRISRLPGVGEVVLVTADEGWEKFKESRKNDLDLSGIQGNPLPDSFRVKMIDPKLTDTVAKRVGKMRYVDEVVQASELVAFMVRFADLVKIIGCVVAGALFLVMAFIVSNTIRLMIFARRREIRIMQLVGATNWFIRLPLIFEGTILGALGGGAACALIYGTTRSLTEWVTHIMPFLSEFSSNVDPLWFFAGLAGIGWIVGAVGSLISIQRFLSPSHQ